MLEGGEGSICPEIFFSALIQNEPFIVTDFFLYNPLLGKAAEPHMNLSDRQLVQLLREEIDKDPAEVHTIHISFKQDYRSRLRLTGSHSKKTGSESNPQYVSGNGS